MSECVAPKLVGGRLQILAVLCFMISVPLAQPASKVNQALAMDLRCHDAEWREGNGDP